MLSLELRGMCQVWVFVTDVGVGVVTNIVLVIPHPRAAQPWEEIGEDCIDPPVAAHAEVEAVVPVVGNDHPGKQRSHDDGPPLSRDEEGDGGKECYHHPNDKHPLLGSRFGGLPQANTPGLGDGGKVVNHHLLDLSNKGILLVVLPDKVCPVVARVERPQICGLSFRNLVFIQDTHQLLVINEVVMALEHCCSVPVASKVERDRTARVLEAS